MKNIVRAKMFKSPLLVDDGMGSKRLDFFKQLRFIDEKLFFSSILVAH